MSIAFNTQKQVVKTQTEPFTLEQLTKLINSQKPTEIFNGVWSHKIPFIVITQYNDEGFLMYCNGWADKEPQQYDGERLHKFLKYQGLGACYINN